MEIGVDFTGLGNHMWVSQQQAGDVYFLAFECSELERK